MRRLVSILALVFAAVLPAAAHTGSVSAPGIPDSVLKYSIFDETPSSAAISLGDSVGVEVLDSFCLFGRSRKLASGVFGLPEKNNVNEISQLTPESWQGHDYLHARYYDPNLGRFLTTDPATESMRGRRPQSWNRYAYVLNNPLRYTDPTGLLWFKIGDDWQFLENTDEIYEVNANDDGSTSSRVVKGVSTGVFFDGGTLTLMKSDGTTRSLPAVSGEVSGWGDLNVGAQHIADSGPIPEGTYSFKTSDVQGWSDLSLTQKAAAMAGRGEWPGGPIKWGRQRVFLVPTKYTQTYGRSGFSIHGGRTPGSAGCIDLCDMVGVFFTELLGDADPSVRVPVDVDYPD